MATPYEYGPVKEAGEGAVIQMYLSQVPRISYTSVMCLVGFLDSEYIDSNLHIRSVLLKARHH